MNKFNVIHLQRWLRANAAMRALRDRLAPGITFFSICSGIEAASVAWNPLGWRAVGFAEIEKFPSAVLAHHYPDVPNLGDFTKIDTSALGRVDILCGGTPCQSFSLAGARRGLNDARGNLTLSFVELAHELADGNGLRNVIWENVPGVLSDKTNAFGCFLAGLVGAVEPLVAPGKRWPNAGMVAGPEGRAAWRVLDAQFWGLAQRRKRVIVVADFGNGADPAAVLFEPEGVRRDSPPSRETGQGVAAAASKGAGSGGKSIAYAIGSHAGAADGDQTNRSHATGGPVGSNINEEVAYSLRAGRTQSVAYAPPIARCVATREGSSQDYESTTMVAVVHGTQDPCTSETTAFALGRNNGSENVIAFSAKDYGADASNDIAPTLRAGGHTGSHANADVMRAICQTVALRGREGGATAELGGDIATALRASSGGGDKPHVLTYSQDHGSNIKPSAISPTLTKEGPSGSAGGNGAEVLSLTSAVRRLTPRECERLQGFQFPCAPTYPGAWQDDQGRWWSPDYTAIPYRKVSARKLDADFTKYLARGNPKNLTREEAAALANDGPRYKALGNSWAVPLFTWLGERIQRFMPAR